MDMDMDIGKDMVPHSTGKDGFTLLPVHGYWSRGHLL